MTKKIPLLIFFIVFPLFSEAAEQDSIVEINVHLPSGAWKQGTGFFYRNDGSIITAYHVIEGAKKINVIVNRREGSFSDVIVDFISPQYDIAVIRVPSLNNSVSFLNLANYVPQVSEQLKLIGYPRMGNLDIYLTNVTSEQYVKSKTIRDQDGEEIFVDNIDVITINTTNYVGLSGAPVVGRRGVIGILSGSYAEGGAKAWVIPTMYFGKVDRIDKRPEQISDWKPMTLLSKKFRDLRRSLNINSEDNRMISEFLSQVEEIANVRQQIIDSAVRLRAKALVLHQTIAVSSSSQAADAQLDPLLHDYDNFGKMITKTSEISMDMAKSAANIQDWINYRISLNPSLGDLLIRRMAEIRDQYANVGDSFFDAIGHSEADDRAVLATAMKFAALDKKTDAEVLSIFDNFAVTLQAYVTKFCSVQAIQFTSRSTGKYRALAKFLMEIASEAPRQTAGPNVGTQDVPLRSQQVPPGLLGEGGLAVIVPRDVSVSGPSDADAKQRIGKTVRDFAGLLWTQSDNNENVDWKSADVYCRNLKMRGGVSWRLPTISELKRLYDGESHKMIKITEPFQVNACYLWASNKSAFQFDTGKEDTWLSSSQSKM